MRKIISLILLFVMLICAIPSYAAQGADFERSMYIDEIKLLESLGVLEKSDSFSSNSSLSVTKGEAARILIRLIGLGDVCKNLAQEGSYYKDVKGTTNYANEINAATALGFFGNEYGDYFFPTERAKTKWMTDAIIRLMGYSHLVEAGKAASYYGDIMKGINSSQYLRRDYLLGMLVNTLEIPITSVYGYEDETEIRLDKGANILSEYFDIKTVEDVLCSTAYESVKGESCGDGQVKLGDILYSCSYDEINSLIGRRLKAYVKKEKSGNGTILFCTQDENEIIEISSQNARYVYSEHAYYITNGAKEEKKPLSSTTLISYNGDAVFDKTKMSPKSGSVTLINNDKDSAYDVCIIKEYTNLIVSDVDSINKTIYDKFDPAMNIREGDFEALTIYSEARKIISISDIKPDSVLTVYKSYDQTRVTAYASPKAITAVINEIDSENKIIKADGVEYKLSGDIRNTEASSLYTGKSYYLYINYWGEIAHAMENSSHFVYWLTDSLTTGSMDKKVQIKGLSEGGNVEVYELADKVKILTYDDGYKTYKNTEALDKLFLHGNLHKQMLKLSINDEKKVNEIVIAYELNDPGALYTMKDYPLIHAAYYADHSKWPASAITNPNAADADKKARHYNPGSFGNWLTYSSDTREMHVPLDTTLSDWDYEDLKVSSIRFGTSSPELLIKDINVYFTSKNNVAIDYLIKDIANTNEVNWNKDGYFLSPYVVNSVSSLLDEDGNKVQCLEITGRYSAAKKYYTTEADTVSFAKLLNKDYTTIPAGKNAIEPGDIIALELNKKNKIPAVRLVYDGDMMLDIYNDGQNFFNSTSDTVTATVLSSKDGIIAYSVDDGHGNGAPQGSIYTANIKGITVEYNSKTKETRHLATSEIYTGDKIVLYYRYGGIYMAVVYKNN